MTARIPDGASLESDVHPRLSAPAKGVQREHETMYDTSEEQIFQSGHAPERLGVALGSGGARGWSHIGVLTELEARGIKPDIVAGSSMGALVGAAYATGRLTDLEEWALRLSPRRMLALLDPTLRRGGLMEGARVVRFLKDILPDVAIEELETPYLAVAADLNSGQEIWLREGSLIEAVRASIALPGVFSPAPRKGAWLVDGGLVNPVPVSAAKALGADIVIAVNPNSKLRRRPPSGPDQNSADLGQAQPNGSGLTRLRNGLSRATFALGRKAPSAPSYIEVISSAMDVMTDRIRSSRLAGEPPHVLIQPRLSHRSVLEFYRASEAIEEGRASVRREAGSLDAYYAEPENETRA